MSRAAEFNPELFEYDPGTSYPWLVHPSVTIAVVTWNRIEHTRALLASLDRCVHLPYRLLVVDNASEDGTRELLRAVRDERPDTELVLNSANLGLPRAHVQIQERVEGDLVVVCDNDVELLSSYWLVHLQKAFHALRLAGLGDDVALGPRLLNCEEYGLLFGGRHETFPVASEQNAPPRSSYAAVGKDDPDAARHLDEQVHVAWTEHLVGPIQAIPVALLKRLELREQYPTLIGGTDSFQSAEILRCGGRLGYVKNGPVARHNDWPYSEDKLRHYEGLVGRRAPLDLHYLRWRWRHFWRGGRSRDSSE